MRNSLPNSTAARRFVACLLVLAGCTASSPATPVRLPARLVNGRFSVRPVTTGGDTLGLILDSGGGINMLWSEAAARLRLPMDSVRTPAEDGEPAQTVGVVPYPQFAPHDSIPSAEQVMIGRRLFVPNRIEIRDSLAAPDGFLGRFWFRDHIWVLDYLAGTLSVYPPGAAPLPAGQHQVPLGFAHNAVGHRTTHFPRIRVMIAGDSIDMLFDTGATLSLTQSALTALADATPSARGGSFISRAVFDRWRTAHPDWRVIEHADSTGGSADPIIQRQGSCRQGRWPREAENRT